jgi:DnaJ-domain-containing protein 1
MLPMLVVGMVLLVCGLLFIRWFIAAEPSTLALAAKATGATILVVLAGYLALTGRIGWILGLLPFLLPLLLRRVSLGGAATLRGFSASAKPRMSNVRTRFLEMRLDHETGELDGDVAQGAYAGRQLSAMSTDELLDLLRALRVDDRKSALLLEAYLDRRCPDWQTRTAGDDAGPGAPHDDGAAAGGTMSAEDAYRVLGLEPGASEAAIREAYHRLIASVHPDRGGSSFLAAQVNRAKDVLLGGKSAR